MNAQAASNQPSTLHAIERWFALGLDDTRNTVILAGFSYTEEMCNELAIERKTNDEMPYQQYKCFRLDDDTGPLIADWLKSWGLGGPQIRKIIRSVGKWMLRAMEAERKGTINTKHRKRRK